MGSPAQSADNQKSLRSTSMKGIPELQVLWENISPIMREIDSETKGIPTNTIMIRKKTADPLRGKWIFIDRNSQFWSNDKEKRQITCRQVIKQLELEGGIEKLGECIKHCVISHITDLRRSAQTRAEKLATWGLNIALVRI